MASQPKSEPWSPLVRGAVALGAASTMLNLVQFAWARQRKRSHAVDLRTGLLSYAAWNEIALRSLDRVVRSNARGGLLMIDVDHLKSINDRFGHARGDELIARVGATLRDSLRRGDVATRYGGDEFAVFIPEAGDAACRRIANRIHSLLAGAAFAEADGARASVSIGYAVYPADGADLQTLIERADCGLYAAKSAGGAQTRHAQDDYVGLDAPWPVTTSRNHPSTS